MMGKGKYDELCTLARLSAKADGAVLMILNGEYGSGFAAQLTPELASQISGIIRQVAAEIEVEQQKAHAN